MGYCSSGNTSTARVPAVMKKLIRNRDFQNWSCGSGSGGKVIFDKCFKIVNHEFSMKIDFSWYSTTLKTPPRTGKQHQNEQERQNNKPPKKGRPNQNVDPYPFSPHRRIHQKTTHSKDSSVDEKIHRKSCFSNLSFRIGIAVKRKL